MRSIILNQFYTKAYFLQFWNMMESVNTKFACSQPQIAEQNANKLLD